ncbi:MAG: hypothetical protein U0835_00450 [Isosphaeraceae bacterium]
MTPARAILALIRLQREPTLLDAILLRLCDRGRILPGEELQRELWGNWHLMPVSR